MQHKIDQNISHSFANNTNNTSSSVSESNIDNQALLATKLPSSHFKAYLKSKVHRPHVSEEFIQHIKTNINKV